MAELDRHTSVLSQSYPLGSQESAEARPAILEEETPFHSGDGRVNLADDRVREPQIGLLAAADVHRAAVRKRDDVRAVACAQNGKGRLCEGKCQKRSPRPVDFNGARQGLPAQVADQRPAAKGARSDLRMRHLLQRPLLETPAVNRHAAIARRE